MPSMRPVKPSRSLVVALTEMRPGATPSMSASLAIMAGACGVIFGRSHTRVTSALASTPPFAAMRPAAWRRKRAEFGVLPTRLAGRKMPADIALGERAVNGVAQRVDADIGVGMPGEPAVMRHLDAAQDQAAALGQRMHVIAGADARDQRTQQDAFQPHQILLVGQLDVVLGAGDQRDRVPGRFQDGGVVGGAGRGGAVQSEQQRKVERLRGLRPVQPGARHRFDDAVAGVAAFQRIGDRHRRNGARRLLQCREQRRHRARRHVRAGGVVHQHHLRRVRRQRFQPGAHAVLAGGAAGHDRQECHSGQRGADGVRVADRLDEVQPGRQPVNRMADHGAAGKGQVLLGRLGAETAAGAGGDEKQGDAGTGHALPHRTTQAGLAIGAARRCRPREFPPANDAASRYEQPGRCACGASLTALGVGEIMAIAGSKGMTASSDAKQVQNHLEQVASDAPTGRQELVFDPRTGQLVVASRPGSDAQVDRQHRP